MPRYDILLLIIIAGELAVGGVALNRQLAQPQPPVTDWEMIDSQTAAELAVVSQQCRTVADWRDYARALMAYGFFAEAAVCFEQASTMDPDVPKIRYEWACALTRLGQLEQANEQFQAALELDYPAPDDCRYFIGRNHLRQEDTVAAADTFREAESMAAARFELIKLQWRSGQTETAVEQLDELLRFHPGALKPSLLRAQAASIAGEHVQAAQILEAADLSHVQLPTPFAALRTQLENARQEYGFERMRAASDSRGVGPDPEQTAKMLADALEVRWWMAGALQLAEIEAQLGKIDEATQRVQAAITRDGPVPKPLTTLGVLYRVAGKPELARATWERVVWRGPVGESADAHRYLAELFQEIGERETARQHAGQAQTADAIRVFQQGEILAAQNLLEQATRGAPTHARGWYYLGEVYRIRNNPRAARQAYQRCVSQDPDYPHAQQRLQQLD